MRVKQYKTWSEASSLIRNALEMSVNIPDEKITDELVTKVTDDLLDKSFYGFKFRDDADFLGTVKKNIQK